MIPWSLFWKHIPGGKHHGRVGVTAEDGQEQETYMATVRASRVSGQVNLFDSEHQHSNHIELTINSARRERGLSNDWIYSDTELITVRMSMAQWATMISSLNYGSGTPATLDHILMEQVEQPKRADDRTSQYHDEMTKTLEKALSKIDELAETKLTKKQKSVLSNARMQIAQNMPYVEKQFDEHMENRIEKAKVEIEAAMESKVRGAGLAHLRDDHKGLNNSIRSDVYTIENYAEDDADYSNPKDE